MEHHEMQMLGFEIVAYSGDAKNKLLRCVSMLLKDDLKGAKEVIAEASDLITVAHKKQMSMLVLEAEGKELPYCLTMVHGQDHLMTVVMLRDVLQLIIDERETNE